MSIFYLNQSGFHLRKCIYWLPLPPFVPHGLQSMTFAHGQLPRRPHYLNVIFRQLACSISSWCWLKRISFMVQRWWMSILKTILWLHSSTNSTLWTLPEKNRQQLLSIPGVLHTSSLKVPVYSLPGYHPSADIHRQFLWASNTKCNIESQNMQRLVTLVVALASLSSALIRFQCSQLVVERLDPLVNPGMLPSTHVHQIVGGVSKTVPNRSYSFIVWHGQNSFNATMDPKKDMPGESSCTTCSFSEDFSNYWTAILYFRARNGTFKRVPQTSQISGATAGITVYYMQDALYDTTQKSKVTAFKPVSRPWALIF